MLLAAVVGLRKEKMRRIPSLQEVIGGNQRCGQAKMLKGKIAKEEDTDSQPQLKPDSQIQRPQNGHKLVPPARDLPNFKQILQI